MVIMTTKYGQLGNRLLLFSHFIGNALEHCYTLVNPCFDEYSKYFPSVRSNDFYGNPIYTRLPINIRYEIFYLSTRIIRKIAKRSPFHCSIDWWPASPTLFHLDNQHFVEKAKRKIVLTSGWLFRDSTNVRKHAEEIRQFLAPDGDILDNVNHVLDVSRERADILVGVHIRRGDYREWLGGKYFFLDCTYRSRMNHIREYFEEHGKRVSFLVCSDEPVNTSEYLGLSLSLGTGHFIEDMYSLAGCDYILGPLSSFSAWASFYGNVPLSFISTNKYTLTADDFSVYYS